MNIAVNTRLLINDLHGGIEWFTYESLIRITRSHPEHQFYFLFDRQFDDKYIFSSNITPIILKPRAVHPLLWHYWLEEKVAPALRQINADLFLSPDGMISLKTNVPTLPVIHDINFFHRKNDLPLLKSVYFRKQFRKFAEKASRIATVSEYSKKDITSSWGIDPQRIDVVYNGVSEIFCTRTEKESNLKLIPFFLFVGNLSPRKNVPNLIRAYCNFRDTCNMEYKLLIAGERFFLNREMDSLINKSKYKDDIILLGKQTPGELLWLYQYATALVFVPWFEGFGIPVIEAMKCGTPVIASNTTSIPEISGDAALLVDPGDTAAIASAMEKLIRMDKLKEEIIKRGFEQADKFSWDNTAESLWESILKAIKN